ncbi:hypothetical protein [Pelomonas sp. KK5]|uniref:hypothetical protein n=1 Tax=Pelomonas sp. KK5 TaxID=1855730 RepID=UPI0018E9F8FD|nr:hypothetical protein [Pelomonas sp. KK5]
MQARTAKTRSTPRRTSSPEFEMLRLDHYPQLQLLAWHTPGIKELTARDALSLYERNWRHVDQDRLQPQERELIARLARTLAGGRLLV